MDGDRRLGLEDVVERFEVFVAVAGQGQDEPRQPACGLQRCCRQQGKGHPTAFGNGAEAPGPRRHAPEDRHLIKGQRTTHDPARGRQLHAHVECGQRQHPA